MSSLLVFLQGEYRIKDCRELRRVYLHSYTLEKSTICDAALCVLEISLSAVSGLQKWMHDRVRRKLWDMCKLGKYSRDSRDSSFSACNAVREMSCSL